MAILFTSCGQTKILGLPSDEAASHLESGDIDFIREAKLPESIHDALSFLWPVSRIRPQAAFFFALHLESAEKTDSDSQLKSRLLYALALEDANPVIRKETGRKLMFPTLQNEEAFAEEVLKLVRKNSDDNPVSLSSACLYRLGRYSEALSDLRNRENKSFWNRAIYLLSTLHLTQTNSDAGLTEKLREEAVRFFLTVPVDSIWHWALNEFDEYENANSEFFTQVEKAAFSVRAASAGSQYSRGLISFRMCMEEEDENESGPGLISEFFLQYPELIRDLGRVFQYAPNARQQGLELFSGWEEIVSSGSITTENMTIYLLRHYLGRIYRQDGQYDKSSEAFDRALALAPDPLQADACIWYILINALNKNQGTAISQFKTYIPQIHSPPYFSDVLDRLSAFLIAGKDWKGLEEIYTILQNREALGAAAQYAWILGRAVEENLYAPAPGYRDFIKTGYFKTIYEDATAPLYYRALSAKKLGVSFIPERVANQTPAQTAAVAEMEFLTGFFKYNAAAFALPFIREYENDLEIQELRVIAGSLAEAGRTNDSLNLVTRYMGRSDFLMTREDMLLYYPRPFLELTTKYSGRSGIKPELFYAIIRTESYFMPAVVSRSGAVGLCQLMPDTALDMAARIARRTGPDYRTENGIDLTDPETSIHIGSFYINYLIETMGTPMTAILSYNGGLGRVRRWRAAAPALPEDLFLETVEYEETRDFGRRILSAAAAYGYLYYGMNMDEVIADIYR